MIAEGNIDADQFASGISALYSVKNSISIEKNSNYFSGIAFSPASMFQFIETKIDAEEEIRNEQIQANPAIEAEYEQQESDLQELIELYKHNVNSAQLKTLNYATDPLTIPVVVHVVYDPSIPATNISYNQIQSQIDALNAAFNKNYASYNGQVHGQHSIDAQISFCLAQNPSPSTLNWTVSGEPGVMRYPDNTQTKHLTYTEATQPESDSLLSLTHSTPQHFPFDTYLNIWVVSGIDGVNPGPSTLLGYSPQPLQSPLNIWTLDGVVIRYDVFGDNSTGNSFDLIPNSPTVGLSSTHNEGKILVHEVGHYLNLIHTFHPQTQGVCAGDLNSNCSIEGDLICDTPPSYLVNNSAYNCFGSSPNTCTENLSYFTNLGIPNPDDMPENYMYYSWAPCHNTFTAEQINRMRAYIALGRPQLASYQNLASTNPIGCNPILMAEFESINNCVDSVTTFTTYTGSSFSANSWVWDFGDGSPLQATGSSTITHTYTNSGVYNVILEATDGISTVSDTLQVYIGECADYQGCDANWHFGYRVAIDWSGQPSLSFNLPMRAAEGCVSVSDSLGNLLFYSNGLQVYDQNNDTINPFPLSPSGFNNSANAGNSSRQMIYCPDPANTNEFYIFHNDGPVIGTPMNMRPHYSKVSVSGTQASMNSLTTNIPIPFPNGVGGLGERWEVLPHCNGTDYWILSAINDSLDPNNEHDSLAIMLVSQIGITHPNGASLQPKFVDVGYSFRGQGTQIASNSNGTQIAMPAFNGTSAGILLLDFDRISGNLSVSNFYIPFPTIVNQFKMFSICFSPDDNSLYFIKSSSVPNELGVIDLSTGSITILDNVYNFAAMEIAPDGNIWLTHRSPPDWNYMGTIVNPNTPSSAVILPHNLFLDPPGFNQNRGGTGLPHRLIKHDSPPVIPQIMVENSSCGIYTFYVDSCFSDTTYNFFWDSNSDGNADSFDSEFTDTLLSPGWNVITLNLMIGTTSIANLTDSVFINTANSETIAGPNIVCLGQQSQYQIPVGYDTYNWTIINPNNDTTYSNLNSIVNPWTSSGIGMLIVEYEIDNCVGSDTLQVQINSLSISTTVLSNVINGCDGEAVAQVLNGTAPFSYNWSGISSQSTLATNLLTDTATAMCEGLYVLTVEDNLGCIAIDTILIDSVGLCTAPPNLTIPASGSTVSSGLWGTGFFNEFQVRFEGDFIVDADFTIEDCQHVTFASGVTITVLPGNTLTIENSHLYACDSLWQGIVLIKDCHAIVKSSVIEDAEIAIYSSSNSDPWTILNSTFNKNHRHIVVDGDNLNLPVLSPCESTEFLCEELFPIANPGSTLKAPRLNEITYCGVQFINLDSVSFGAPLNVVSNTFRNNSIGIVSYRSTANIQNNHFEGMDGDFILQDALLGNIGSQRPKTGIWSTNSNGPNNRSTYIGGDNLSNTFNNVSRGILVIDPHIVRIDSNYFDRSTPFTSSIGPSNGIRVVLRDMVAASPNTNPFNAPEADIFIHNNHVKNQQFGIVFQNMQSGIVYDSDMSIDYNLVEAPIFQQATGLYFEDAGFEYRDDFGLWIADTNEIRNITTGVHLVGMENNFIDIHTNNIQLRDNISLGTPAAGIRVEGSQANFIRNNVIRGGAGALANDQVKGIYATLSPINHYSCNQIDNTGEALVFEGSSPLVEVNNNAIDSAYNGLVLTNGGLIGPQGFMGNPSDNRWSGDFGNFMSLSIGGSDGSLSPFYVRNHPFYDPSVSNSFIPPALPVSYSFTTGTPQADTCLPDIPGDPYHFINPESEYLLRDIAEGKVIYSAFSEENRFLGEVLTYRVLKDSVALRQNNAVLDSFYLANQTSEIGQLEQARTFIANGDLNNAQSINQSILSGDTIVNNLKTCNTCYFRYKDSVFNHNDILVLSDIAMQCPLEHGAGVYKARAMLNVLEDRLYDYTYACDANQAKSFEKVASQGLNVSLYPNPNNGNFLLKYELEESAYMTIYDVKGKLMEVKQLNEGNNVLEVDLILNVGTYFIQIITETGDQEVMKFVVTN